MNVCTAEGCDRPRHGQGLCNLHLKRWNKHGSLQLEMRPRHRVDKDYLFGELDWLLSFGIHPSDAARQLGRTVGSLEKLARDNGRLDLSAILRPEIEHKRRTAA